MPRTTKNRTQSIEPVSDASSTRMTTRPRNATAHPGKVVLENTRARCDKEEIQHEKDLKRAAKVAKEKKAADAAALKAVGRAFVHAEDAAAVANAERDVPHHRGLPAKEIKKATKRKASRNKGVVIASDPETSPSPPLKKIKSNVGPTRPRPRPKPLRRNETMLLGVMSVDEDGGLVSGNRKDNLQTAGYDTDIEITSNADNAGHDDDYQDFQTPLTLKRPNVAKPRYLDSEEDSTSSELSEETDTNRERKKKVGNKQAKVTADTVSDLDFAANERRARLPSVDFHVLSRMTTANSTIATKPAAPQSAASGPARRSTAPKFSASEPVRNGAAPKSSAPEPVRKGAAQSSASVPARHGQGVPKSSVSEPSRHAPKPSVSEPAHVAPTSVEGKRNSSQITMVERAVGGLSDEDDSLEREVAMLSPFKGTELQAAKKSIIKVQANQETKPRKRATMQDLPPGSNHENAWTRLVVPNFIRLIMAGEHPWVIDDSVIISDLQAVWNHVYGRRVPFEIKRGTVPFDLAIQKLYDYQGKIAYKAIQSVFSYLYDGRENQDDTEVDGDEIAKLAKGLLVDQGFIFKGMEKKHQPKKTGTFRHTLVIETLSTHFATFMHGQVLRGLSIGHPQLSLALAAAALERALELFAHGLIEDRPDSKGKSRLSVRKALQANTGVLSTFSTEFSALGWNKITMEYLHAVKGLNEKKLTVIFDEAKELVQSVGQDEMDSHSGRATLCSDEENW